MGCRVHAVGGWAQGLYGSSPEVLGFVIGAGCTPQGSGSSRVHPSGFIQTNTPRSGSHVTSSCLILASLELSDSHVYEPQIRALLGTALHLLRILSCRCLSFQAFAEGKTRWPERDFVIDNLLVRNHFIIVMIGWTGLRPWEFEFPFRDSLTSTFHGGHVGFDPQETQFPPF